MSARERILTIRNKYIDKYAPFLQDLKEAIAGTDQDFTEGRLGRAIFLLSVPMVLEMVMESMFAVADIFFVSKLGADAIATVGITESMITIVYAVGFGLAMSTSSLVSRRIGEKNPAGAAVAAVQAIYTGIGVSLLIAVPGILWADDLLRLMGANRNIVNGMSGYTRLMLGGNVVIMLLFIINAVFRSAGDAAVAMRILWFANLINITLDPILIFGLGPVPAFGVTGAAIATTTGRGLAVCYQLYLLFYGHKRIRITVKDLGIKPKVMWKLVKISFGGIAQNIIATSSWIGLVRIISMFGSTVVAGYTIAIRIIIFALLPSWGLSNAASTLVGQNLGAKKPERAERAVWFAARVNMIMLAVMGVVLMVFSGFFIRLFISDGPVVEVGIFGLRIISAGFVAYGAGMVLVNAFNGAGDTMTPTRINVFCFWLFEIPLAWALAVWAGMEQTGVFTAIVIAETAMTIVAWRLFRKGSWKLKQV
jgi:putative MATE family efflux protein